MCVAVAVNLYHTVWLKVPPAHGGFKTSPAWVVPSAVVPAIQAAFTVRFVAFEQLSLGGWAKTEVAKAAKNKKKREKSFIYIKLLSNKLCKYRLNMCLLRQYYVNSPEFNMNNLNFKA